MRNIWFNSALAVLLMLWLAWNNAFAGLWPLFGVTNQLTASLTLLALSAWLLKRGRQAWFTLIPATFMVFTTIAALFSLLLKFIGQLGEASSLSGPLTLLVMDVLALALAFCMVGLAVKTIRAHRKKGAAAASAPAGDLPADGLDSQ